MRASQSDYNVRLVGVRALCKVGFDEVAKPQTCQEKAPVILFDSSVLADFIRWSFFNHM